MSSKTASKIHPHQFSMPLGTRPGPLYCTAPGAPSSWSLVWGISDCSPEHIAAVGDGQDWAPGAPVPGRPLLSRWYSWLQVRLLNSVSDSPFTLVEDFFSLEKDSVILKIAFRWVCRVEPLIKVSWDCVKMWFRFSRSGWRLCLHLWCAAPRWGCCSWSTDQSLRKESL